MTVYVDPPIWPFGRMKMCHCWADTREELFEMMTTIGVQHKWFQRPESAGVPGMKASWEHFDISKSKRALAVKNGAVETDQYGCIEFEAWQRINSGNPKLMTIGAKQLIRICHVRQLKDRMCPFCKVMQSGCTCV